MEVPEWLHAQVSARTAVVDGALVKSASTGKILGHLQASGALAKLLARSATAAAPGAPPARSAIAELAELLRGSPTGSLIPLLTGVSAATALLGLGVTIGGFALALGRLDEILEQLAGIDAKLGALHALLAPIEPTKMRTALSRCENAHHGSAREQERIWREEERHLDEAAAVALAQLEALARRAADGRLTLWEAGLDADRLADRIELPLLCSQVRTDALLLLRDPAEARRAAIQRRAWIEQLDVRPRDYIKARRRGAALGTRQIAHELQAVTRLRDALHCAALQSRDRAALCDTIREQRLDSRRIVEEARDHPEPALLFLPRPRG
jgi:hypothetical protein